MKPSARMTDDEIVAAIADLRQRLTRCTPRSTQWVEDTNDLGHFERVLKKREASK